jgi:hypothetical protein
VPQKERFNSSTLQFINPHGALNRAQKISPWHFSAFTVENYFAIKKHFKAIITNSLARFG